MSELWRRLDSVRSQNGVSLKDMGKLCGISPQGVQRWKTSGKVPLEHVHTLAAHFGVSVDWLLGRGEEAAPLRKVGSVTSRETLAYRQMPTAWLEEEARKTVESIPPAPRGRGRIGVIGTAIDILVELQERCVDEWTGKPRRLDGTRDGDPPTV